MNESTPVSGPQATAIDMHQVESIDAKKDRELQAAHSRERMVISFLWLRILVGAVGFLLPIILLVGGMLYGMQDNPDSSISAYYFSPMRDWFVGILWVIGGFLIGYNGRKRSNRKYSDGLFCSWAGLFLIMVAMFPTNLKCGTGTDSCTAIISLEPDRTNADAITSKAQTLFEIDPLVGLVHIFSAGLFFALMAFVAAWRFTMWPEQWEWSERRQVLKTRRNRLYQLMAAIMAICVVGIGVEFFWFKAFLGPATVFYLEGLAIWAFAVVWLISGQFIPGIRDEAPEDRPVPDEELGLG